MQHNSLHSKGAEPASTIVGIGCIRFAINTPTSVKILRNIGVQSRSEIFYEGFTSEESGAVDQ